MHIYINHSKCNLNGFNKIIDFFWIFFFNIINVSITIISLIFQFIYHISYNLWCLTTLYLLKHIKVQQSDAKKMYY